jgi:hypothetical protein
MGRRSLVPLLLLLLPGAASAQAVIELPPGEDPAQWQAALQLGRQLLPELELGQAVGPGPSVRILSGEEGWLLDVRTAQGVAEPITMATPDGEAARLELLLVCVDAMGGHQAAPSDQPDESPAELIGPWRWRPLSFRVGIDVVPGDHRPPRLQLEPASLAWNRLGMSPVLSWSTPVDLGPEHRLRGAAIGVDAWYEVGGRVRGRLGAGLNLELREIAARDTALMRDWSLAPMLGTELCIPIRGGWRGLLGLQLTGALPPTILELGDDEIALPTWQVLATAGVRLPWPSSSL